eukprot:jgi/Undpi1/82/HiC_scaffold_1.g00082.m1
MEDKAWGTRTQLTATLEGSNKHGGAASEPNAAHRANILLWRLVQRQDLRTEEDVDIRALDDGGYFVGWLARGEYLRYSVSVTEDVEEFYFSFRVSSNNGLGSFRVVSGGNGCDDYGTTLSGLVDVPHTGGWNSYEDITVSGGGDGGLASGSTFIWLCVVTAGLDIDSFTMTPAVVPYGGVAAKIPGLIEAEEFDYGGEGVAYTDTSETNHGGAFRPNEAVDIQSVGDGFIVGWMAKDEYMRYTVDVTENVDAFDFSFRVSSNSGFGKLRIVTGGTGCDSYSTSLSGLVSVPNTGGWYSYEDVSVSGGGDGGLGAGINHIWLCVVSAGLNVDLFTMTPAVVPYGGVAAKIPGLIEAEEFDYGGEGVAYTDTSETNHGGAFRTDEAVDIEPVGDGFVVGWMGKDEYMRYTVDVTENVAGFDFSFRVSSNSGFGKLRIVSGGTGCDDYSTDLSGLVSVPNTGGWYDYEDVAV